MRPNVKRPDMEPGQQSRLPLIVRQAGYPDIIVETLAEASRRYCERRDQTGLGASTFPDATLLHEDIVAGRISYNGRIWHPIPWRPGDKPIYDNAACRGDQPER